MKSTVFKDKNCNLCDKSSVLHMLSWCGLPDDGSRKIKHVGELVDCSWKYMFYYLCTWGYLSFKLVTLTRKTAVPRTKITNKHLRIEIITHGCNLGKLFKWSRVKVRSYQHLNSYPTHYLQPPTRNVFKTSLPYTLLRCECMYSFYLLSWRQVPF
jgi:hypothetical protein